MSLFSFIMSWEVFQILLLLMIICWALQAFIPDAKDALEEVDVLKKETLTDMDKQLGKKEASPGFVVLPDLCSQVLDSQPSVACNHGIHQARLLHACLMCVQMQACLVMFTGQC